MKLFLTTFTLLMLGLSIIFYAPPAQTSGRDLGVFAGEVGDAQPKKGRRSPHIPDPQPEARSTVV